MGLARAFVVAVILLVLPGAASARAASTATPPHGPPAVTDGPDGRLRLAGRWTFRLDAETAWRPVAIPNAWNATDVSEASMAGTVGWYRREFRLPARGRDRPWLVRFLSVNHRAQVWLNGKPIGANGQPYVPFTLPLPGLRRTGVNVLLVRVDNRRLPTDFPATAFPPGGRIEGGWWNYGGILREVEMRPVEAVDLADVRVLPRLACRRCNAVVRVRARLVSHSGSAEQVRVRGRIGAQRFGVGAVRVPAHGSAVVATSVRVRHPHLWSPADPHLEPVVVEAETARGVSRWRLHTGIRSIRVSGGRLLLNGLPLRVRGVGVHEDEPGRGAALTPAGRERIVRGALAVGATMIRAHYPLHPHVLELADRLGLLVWSEVPVYRLPSERLDVGRAVALARRAAEDGANHPSVMAWSLGNELSPTPGPTEADLFRRAADAVRAVDPTRPVALALEVKRPVACQPAYAPLDLLGINEYFGWYYGATPDVSAYLDALRACYPRQALLVSELGVEANRDGPVEERGTYAFQAAWADAHLSILASKPWLSGESWWTLGEFKVRPGWTGGNPVPDPPMHHKGLLTYSGVPKPAWAIVRRWYTAPAPAR